MYPVGHITFACGVVWSASRLIDASREARVAIRATPARHSARPIDYRLVAFGALLPDLIDKPIAWSGLAGPHSGGHYIGHALIIPAALLLVGAILARFGRWEVLLIGIATFSHVFADSLTHPPRSLFWPFFTIPISRNETLVGATNIAAETVGSVVILYLLAKFYREGRLARLVLQGSP